MHLANQALPLSLNCYAWSVSCSLCTVGWQICDGGQNLVSMVRQISPLWVLLKALSEKETKNCFHQSKRKRPLIFCVSVVVFAMTIPIGKKRYRHKWLKTFRTFKTLTLWQSTALLVQVILAEITSTERTTNSQRINKLVTVFSFGHITVELFFCCCKTCCFVPVQI